MKTVLVLGGSGFIGSHLVASLLPDYRVVDYSAVPLATAPAADRYQYVAGNYCEEQDFEGLLRMYQPFAVYHFISTTTPRNGTAHVAQEVDQNLLPTIRLLEAACRLGVERIIFPSSGGTVYGEGVAGCPHQEKEPLVPICSYGVQKMAIEGLLRMYQHMHGIRTLIARVSNPYGLCQQSGRTQGIIPILLQKLHREEPITLFGETVRDYIYIDDVTRAMVCLLTYGGEESVFNIGSGQGTHLHQLVRQIEEISGKRFASVEQEDIRSCDVRTSVLDISLAARELDWVPRVTLEDGIRRTLRDMGL
ncbi:MAG: NAD-dependent epimerase/dehydratase family protein [Oscillospiraceae bacterium]|jgi:UDP-glucose 4-epimerase|nr:NAD-dependent epimerase/dehydratase family protein [Oscillospiraceae bacterium]